MERAARGYKLFLFRFWRGSGPIAANTYAQVNTAAHMCTYTARNTDIGCKLAKYSGIKSIDMQMTHDLCRNTIVPWHHCLE